VFKCLDGWDRYYKGLMDVYFSGIMSVSSLLAFSASTSNLKSACDNFLTNFAYASKKCRISVVRYRSFSDDFTVNLLLLELERSKELAEVLTKQILDVKKHCNGGQKQ